jgi:hypothetical protein
MDLKRGDEKGEAEGSEKGEEEEDGINDEMGTDDINQLRAIILTGIAYLNNNDAALAQLYRLLTGQRHDSVTVERLKKNPGLLIFVLQPAVIHNHIELKRFNDLMEKSILSAAQTYLVRRNVLEYNNILLWISMKR